MSIRAFLLVSAVALVPFGAAAQNSGRTPPIGSPSGARTPSVGAYTPQANWGTHSRIGPREYSHSQPASPPLRGSGGGPAPVPGAPPPMPQAESRTQRSAYDRRPSVVDYWFTLRK